MFTKINANRALRMFVEGKTVYLGPCNLRPELFAVAVNPAMIEGEDSSPRTELFVRAVAVCRYYNCINNETGRRVAYYIKEEE